MKYNNQLLLPILLLSIIFMVSIGFGYYARRYVTYNEIISKSNITNLSYEYDETSKISYTPQGNELSSTDIIVSSSDLSSSSISESSDVLGSNNARSTTSTSSTRKARNLNSKSSLSSSSTSTVSTASSTIANNTNLTGFIGSENYTKCASHDVHAWHSIKGMENGIPCYYDHEHGDNPADADNIFGPIGANVPTGLWHENSVGKPFAMEWHTSEYENTTDTSKMILDKNYVISKHEGHKVEVLKYSGSRDPNNPRTLYDPCYRIAYQGWLDSRYSSEYLAQPHVGLDPANPINCITDIRIVHHWRGDVDLASRFHTVYREMKICKQITVNGDKVPDFNNCGIIRQGTWTDYGDFHLPYKETLYKLPSVDPTETKNVTLDTRNGSNCVTNPFNNTTFCISNDPYRAIDNSFKINGVRIDDLSFGMKFVWNTLNNYSYAYPKSQSGLGGGNDSRVVLTSCQRYISNYNCLQNTGITSHKFFVFDNPMGFKKSTMDRLINSPTAEESQLSLADKFRLSILHDCPDGKCRFNNSERAIFEATGYVDPTYDGSTKDIDNLVNGKITFKEWSCIDTPSATCIPNFISYENVPIGPAIWGRNEGDNIDSSGRIHNAQDARKDFDTFEKGIDGKDIWAIDPEGN